MTGRQSAIGVGLCIFAILCILNREIITFVLFYVLPFGVFSFFGSLIFAAGSGDEASVDYQDLAIRFFVVGVISVITISLADRTYDKKGHFIRNEFSQGLNESYNGLTEKLEMGIEFLRPETYEWGIFDGVTLLKMIALGLILGGPLIAFGVKGGTLPRRTEKQEEENPAATDEKKDSLQSDIYRLQRIISDHQTETSKKEIEIQALRAENRSLKKKLGDPQ